MFTTSLRGLGQMAAPQQVMVSVPQPAPDPPTQMPTAETSLANAAYQDVEGYTQFLQAQNDPQYQSPAAYTANMIAYAQTLCMASWSPYTCVTNSGGSFNPTTMGTQYANAVFAALKSIILPSTGKSVYDTWVANPPSTYSNYTPPQPVQPYNAGSVPGSSVLPTPPSNPNVLNNVAPPPITPPVTNPTSVLNPPPVVQTPITQTQIANGSGIALPNLSGVTSFVETNWVLIAAGVAALVILPGLLGGRR